MNDDKILVYVHVYKRRKWWFDQLVMTTRHSYAKSSISVSVKVVDEVLECLKSGTHYVECKFY